MNYNLKQKSGLIKSTITKSETSIYLQGILQWDPPSEFSAWLHKITKGQISLMLQTIALLIRRGILQHQNGKWLVNSGYSSIQERDVYQQQAMILNLPLPRNALIDRVQIRQQIVSLLKTEHLLTITGPGGVGKSRLALQVGYDCLSQFQHGISFVPLLGIESEFQLALAIIQALGVSTYGQGVIDEQLIDYLRNKHILLILDNYEHLLPATDLLVKILENAPGVHILITSQERLNMYQESVVNVKNFPLVRDEDTFEKSDAAQLFLQRARKVRQNFILETKQVPYVYRICELVGGLPLGIELAASWIRVLTCQEIAQELEKDFDLLQTEMQDV